MLTGRQQEIWDFLVDYVERHGYPPTVREIGDAVGLASPSTVQRTSRTSSGPASFAAIRPSRARSSCRGAAATSPSGLRTCIASRSSGEIAAGGPLLAEENIEDELAVPEPLGRNADFLLRVKGDSMIEAGILDGDIVVVRRQDTAQNGDIVVALAGDDEAADEATVKRFFREDGRVRLQPENAALGPIYAAHVRILGRVVGVFRVL